MANATQTFWEGKIENIHPEGVDSHIDWTETDGVVSSGPGEEFEVSIDQSGLISVHGVNQSVLTTYLIGHLHDH